MVNVRRAAYRVLKPIPGAVPAVRLVIETVKIAFRYRVTGLSAEAAFFMLLSMPPLLLGLIAGVGFMSEWIGAVALTNVTNAIAEWSARFLTPEVVDELIMPTVEDTLQGGRADLLSIGFVLSLWAGSRALHVFMDTISIMYGQTGIRGIVGSRVLSLSLYAGSILFGSIIFPLVLIGPDLLASWLPAQVEPVLVAYWPVVGLSALVGLTGLFHFATPQKSPFVRDIPGAVLAAVIIVVASALLRAWAVVAIGGATIFGPLTAPIIVLIWFYLIAVAILVGAALNAAIRRLWPPPEYRGPIVRANEWWEHRRSPEEPPEPRHPLTPVDREEHP